MDRGTTPKSMHLHTWARGGQHAQSAAHDKGQQAHLEPLGWRLSMMPKREGLPLLNTKGSVSWRTIICPGQPSARP